jgi:beta-glucanase (GH16 family)
VTSRSHRLVAAATALLLLPLLVTAATPPTSADPAPFQARASATPRPWCGGKRIRKAGGGYWRCIWSDEFTGPRLKPKKWTAVSTEASGYRSGVDCYRASPNNVWVYRGVLRLRVRAETMPFLCRTPLWGGYLTRYTGGMVTTAKKFARTYGRFEARVRFPKATVAGLQSAFWLWPTNPNRYGPFPDSGEIDVGEFYTRYPDRIIPVVHYSPKTYDPYVTYNYCMITRPSHWHTMTLVWTRKKMVFSYDGRPCFISRWKDSVTVSRPAPFDKPFYINLTQGLGIATNDFAAGRTPLPATMRVDYVRVWR